VVDVGDDAEIADVLHRRQASSYARLSANRFEGFAHDNVPQVGIVHVRPELPETPPRPLRDRLVLDVSRMLPGAILARMLLDLGARLIKVEKPGEGDPLRHAPPRVDGVGAGFRWLCRGAESVTLDLREPRDAAILRRAAGRADVLVESFRPGSLETWGLGPEELQRENPALVICSLSGFGPHSTRVAHDLNCIGLSGLLELLAGDGIPGVQVADVGSGMLACSAILAALLERERTGRGLRIDQPLCAGPLPFVAWPLADAAAGDDSLTGGLLAGRCPAYRHYECGDGTRLAVAALEPKFWVAFVRMLDLDDIDSVGLDLGDSGRDAARRVQAVLETRPRSHWLRRTEAQGLPVSAVNDLAGALDDAVLRRAGTVGPHGPGPFLPSFGTTSATRAPLLGEQTARLLKELDADDERR
jgi:crotonobetainyl-CoA:carnitine CoA-transferase CaiB-like acyl-CoA transferase